MENQTVKPEVTNALVMDDGPAALILGMSVFTLRKWRSTGHGPAYVKLGKSVKYRLEDLTDFIKKQVVNR